MCLDRTRHGNHKPLSVFMFHRAYPLKLQIFIRRKVRTSAFASNHNSCPKVL
jgi:hypothetical protein